MEDAPLQAALEKLVDADILLVEGLPTDADYRFKHALIQDAAYENLSVACDGRRFMAMPRNHESRSVVCAD
jgi:hypothetical protein